MIRAEHINEFNFFWSATVMLGSKSRQESPKISLAHWLRQTCDAREATLDRTV